ncbi:alpha/beta hydrolase family esterase [Ulvibacterium marinum]|uniref:Phospholipase/carboxylesterase/thioesterase domain-containing protein n=1 Tax=Ulvibacterium marinum TaxID=2419782 RepID=A0A3B0CBQ3_9FLAO|nr:PHB depolymerase family esterase [Ulvibacterium marinum]RKN83522.1 hypothetical protein D7Z94_06810 [Ulvibacterium marinum]
MKTSIHIKTFILFWALLTLLSCDKSDESLSSEEIENTKESHTEKVVTISNGDQREYIVYTPSTYDEKNEHPLVFQLHGSSGNGEKFYTISGWNALAEQHNFIAVYPTSYVYDLRLKGCGNDLVTKWNNYNLPKEVCPTETLRDDTAFFNQILDELMNAYSIDESRIYMAGFSNGSGMVSRLAVELSDKITAVGGLAGFFPEDTIYAPKRIRPLHLMLGTTDEKIASRTIFQDTIPMDFQQLFTDPTLRGITQTYIKTFDLDPNYSVMDSTEYTLTATFKGKSGEPNHLMKFTLWKDLGHFFPNPDDRDGAADVLWEFFEMYQNNP